MSNLFLKYVNAIYPPNPRSIPIYTINLKFKQQDNQQEI